MPNLVKQSLEKGKIQENEWDDKSKLNKLINECIIIENTIKNINEIYDKVKGFNSQKNIEFKFEPKNEEDKNNIIKTIKDFGNIKMIGNNKYNNEEDE